MYFFFFPFFWVLFTPPLLDSTLLQKEGKAMNDTTTFQGESKKNRSPLLMTQTWTFKNGEKKGFVFWYIDYFTISVLIFTPVSKVVGVQAVWELTLHRSSMLRLWFCHRHPTLILYFWASPKCALPFTRTLSHTSVDTWSHLFKFLTTVAYHLLSR